MNYNKSVWVDVFSEKDFRRYRKGRIVAKLINIGFGNLVSADRLVAVVGPDSAPIKRMVQEARDRGVLIDATYGRRTRAVLIMDSDHIVLSALQPETVAGRLGGLNRPPELPEALRLEESFSLTRALDSYERELLSRAMQQAGSISQAARLLGLSRQNLKYKLKKFDL